MPYRIAIGSCSHPSLPQPLWPIISSRNISAFVWAGDAIYADSFQGLDWKSVGLRRDRETSQWRFTFPPPSVHHDATPEVIRDWYRRQWEDHIEYRKFVEGWERNGNERPLIFGTVDDHDYGQNNGDVTYQYRRESNLEFMNFLYSGVPGEERETGVCQTHTPDDDTNSGCAVDSCVDDKDKLNICDNNKHYVQNSDIKRRIRRKESDPMYQRATQGMGVYGVQLFDFSRDPNASRNQQQGEILWGSGYWVPEHEARIDPDVMKKNSNTTEPSYSTSHSAAIFVLDVRSNKTPWPKKNKASAAFAATPQNNTVHGAYAPAYDFLGEHQWAWFQSALSNSHAAINIIVSGLQIHPKRFPNDGNIVEEWSKFPESQQLLYNTVLNSGVNSPLFVSGDVHMAQILRKDCLLRSELINTQNDAMPQNARPLIEVTTSGLTHSWGTSFSSQPKHHRFPLKAYSYFISPTFMTIAHYVMPWRDLVICSTEDVVKEKEEDGRDGGKAGMQFELGLNFGEFEFDFGTNGQEGAVTVRIYGKEVEGNQAPKLEMRWTFDQLSGKTPMKGMTATQSDFMSEYQQHMVHSDRAPNDWICVPYRGVPSPVNIYASNFLMFIVFCALFFLPHMAFVACIVASRRRLKNHR